MCRSQFTAERAMKMADGTAERAYYFGCGTAERAYYFGYGTAERAYYFASTSITLALPGVNVTYTVSVFSESLPGLGRPNNSYSPAGTSLN